VRWGETGEGELLLGDVAANDQHDLLIRQPLTGVLNVHPSDVVVPVGTEDSDPVTVGTTPEDDEDDLLDAELGVGTVAVASTEPTATAAQAARRRPKPGMILAAQGPVLNTPTGDRDALYARFREAGVTFLRFNVFWGEVEMEDGTYDFGPYDELIDSARRAGFKAYITLTGAEFENCREITRSDGVVMARSLGCKDNDKQRKEDATTTNAPRPLRYGAWECPRICVGMSEQERHVHQEQHVQQDRVGAGVGVRRRLAERARRASAARCRRRGRRGGGVERALRG